MKEIVVYTDGSCHTQLLLGACAAILLIDGNPLTISGYATETTHNRMELQAVIESLKMIYAQYPGNAVHVYSDSQYVVGLQDRKNKIIATAFKTKAGNDIQNVDLVKELWNLQDYMLVRFTKVAAHSKKTASTNHNIEVDKLVRGLLRSAVAVSEGSI